MKFARTAVASTAAILLLSTPTDLTSCGPFIPYAIFITPHGPLDPNDGFTAGKLGVIRPEFRVGYLVVAYRYLSGLPAANTQSLYPAPIAPVPMEPIARWIAARNQFSASKQDRIDTFKSLTQNGQYIAYQACLDDAFSNASKTLEARAATWGPQSPALKDWVAGQDAVFSNCTAKDGVSPQPAPADSPALLLADRAYQLAAAAFYAGDWTAARTRFDRIFLDKTSPWQPYAQYLIARTFIREGTVENKPQALTAARTRLAALVRDPGSSPLHPAAQGLLDYLDVRLTPAPRLQALSDALLTPQLAGNANQQLTDFLYLYWDPNSSAQRQLNVKNDLTDWLTAWKRNAATDAIDRWHRTGGLQWLLLALHQATGQEPDAPELLRASHQVTADSPAYPSIAYYASALHRKRGELDDARAWVDEALGKQLEITDRNLFLAQRLSLARNWSEFLKYSPRRINYKTVDGDDAFEVDPKDEALKYANLGPAFDSDSVDVWNSQVPLSLWIDGAREKTLPINLRAQIAQTGWVRALVLNRPADAKTLLALWRETDPKAAAAAASYTGTRDAAALILLKNPGLSIFIKAGFWRGSPTNQLDNMRENWWCSQSHTNTISPASFLTDNERAQGAREFLEVTKTAQSGTNYVTAETIHLAQSKPADPAIPEALALAVQATRYNPCGTPETGALSQQAFNLLKQNYPNTSWARDTKYWYK